MRINEFEKNYPAIKGLAHKVLNIASIIFFTVGCSHGVGSGTPTEQTRRVEAFDQIVVSGRMTMDIEIGDHYGVLLSGDDNIVTAVKTKIENGTLKVQAPKIAIQKKPLHVTVVTPQLSQIAAAITEDIRIQMSGRPLGDIQVRLSGVGKLDVNQLHAERITSTVSGTGKLNIAGTASHMDFRLSGMGNGSFAGLCLKTANVKVHGMGQVVVNANEYLEATVKGIGKVSYYGDPSLQPTLKGGGKIVSLDSGPGSCVLSEM